MAAAVTEQSSTDYEPSGDPVHQVPAATYPAVVGQVLAEARKQRRCSQRDLADTLGCGQSAWSKVERGEVPLTVEQLALVAAHLNTTPGALLARADEAVRYFRAKGVRVLEHRAPDATALGIALVTGAALTTLVAASLGRTAPIRR